MTKSCEALRLLELERIDPLTTASEASFDIITQLVQRIMDVPFAAITVIDKDTQYLKARQGLDLETTPRSDAVCDIVVRSGNVLNIGDMRKDSRVQSNPAVRGSIGLQAYVGAPLTTKAGYHLGSLCALDTKPRQFTEYQIEILSNFAKLVSNLLELRAQADHDFLTKVLNPVLRFCHGTAGNRWCKPCRARWGRHAHCSGHKPRPACGQCRHCAGQIAA